MIYLSKNFTLEEFCTSETAARMGRVISPGPDDITNLTRLCVSILEPLRAELGQPLHVTSGLRPEWLNAAIGGSKTSAHVGGRAADIQVSGLTPLEICQAVRRLNLPVDQCIHEFPPHGWCHVGIEAPGSAARGEYLTARVVGGQTAYQPGISA